MKIASIAKLNEKLPIIYLVENENDLSKTNLTNHEVAFAAAQLKIKNGITFNSGNNIKFILEYPIHNELIMRNDLLRRRAADLCEVINKYQFKQVQIVNCTTSANIAYYAAEGMALGNYQFNEYKKIINNKKNSLAQIDVLTQNEDGKNIARLHTIIEATNQCKHLVNEPYNTLTSVEMAKRFTAMGEQAGVEVEVLNLKKIQSLKMGGILAVNQGSKKEPTFTIMTYKPKGATNKNPLLLVGKGVVYDTGGLSLKPTPDSMDHMKTDMAGAAAVASAICAIAKLKLPYYVIALIPSTDNVIGSNAYVPGDIITMYNKMQVEVLNTDAEGRLILADALTYAAKYNPELVINIATLTGASMRAVGPFAYSYYSTADAQNTTTFQLASEAAYERYVQHPLWDDYDELIQSEFADLKNIGGPSGGSITAAKFLQHFVSYPWMHMDIAGCAWNLKKNNYKSAGANGFGVRTFVEFVSLLCKKNN